MHLPFSPAPAVPPMLLRPRQDASHSNFPGRRRHGTFGHSFAQPAQGAALAGNSDACPQLNGTVLGATQQFTVICGTAFAGDTIRATTEQDLASCALTCSTMHPKCESVAYDGSTCTLQANTTSGPNASLLAQAAASAPSATLTAGVAQFPPASSNCRTLGASTAQGAMNFDLFCDNVIDGADISQTNAATLQDCMAECANTSGCGALSYDAGYVLGFENCYLKTGGGPSPIADPGIDTAVVASNNAVLPNPVNPVNTAASTSDSSTAAVVAPPSSTTALGGGVQTVPIITQTVVSVVTSVGNRVSTTFATTELLTSSGIGAGASASATTGLGASLPAAVPTPINGSPSALPSAVDGAGGGTDGGGGSRAWIAAPVVGSVAAVLVVVVMFVLWGRRRRSNGLSSPLSPAFFNRFRRGGRGGGGGGGSLTVRGTDAGGGSGGFRNLASSDSRAETGGGATDAWARFSRPHLMFGNAWRASGGGGRRDDVPDDVEKSGFATSRASAKSVPLMIDTDLARSLSRENRERERERERDRENRNNSENSDSSDNSDNRPREPEKKTTVVAVAVATDGAMRPWSKDKGQASGRGSQGESPVLTRNLTAGSGRSTADPGAKNRVPLRDSMNGLAQNRTTLDGIPIFLRE